MRPLSSRGQRPGRVKSQLFAVLVDSDYTAFAELFKKARSAFLANRLESGSSTRKDHAKWAGQSILPASRLTR